MKIGSRAAFLMACLSAMAGCGGSSPPPPPEVQIVVEPASITLGQTARLNWTSTGAESCVAASAWTGEKALTGSSDAAPTTAGTYLYQLNCSGADGTGRAMAELEVKTLPVKVANIDRCYGVNYVSFYNSPDQAYDSNNSSRLMANLLARTAGNCVNLVAQLYMETAQSQQVQSLTVLPPEDDEHGPSPTDAQLRYAILSLRMAGLRVFFKPHVDIRDGTYRGNVRFDDEAAFNAWFESYAEAIRHYALLAQNAGAHGFIVGTELNGLVDAHLPYQTAAWRSLIADVRKTFRGKLIYAADWSSVDDVGFWDAVDYVGVDAYFPLTAHDQTTPSVASLVEAWHTTVDPAVGDNALHHLESVVQQTGKPIWFTETGYQSIDACGSWPAGVTLGAEDDPPLNEQCQANAYQAVFDTFAAQPWFVGAMFWDWESYPGASSGVPLDDADPATHYVTRAYTNQNKLAESTLLMNDQAQRLDYSQ